MVCAICPTATSNTNINNKLTFLCLFISLITFQKKKK
ncbi:hypothetical protein SPAB_04725 [Salmonella enterica subsp. enterica serovar Paratyphi B str. SPB7]|uniref:Uncharacterized protein n=1 Tax=Salmonella paratyphi B (strain ATCC BAA-1250 / SPB7) TaxID=1016998 RepID=A0A6C6Z906_SALPB|nr:hypothetical protein SPAB_04725 [Salmonella enterica subsp. enterica serovar Paratyphi B str. SPB7]